ncbi:MAG: copper chaperone PCu(A)C [Alcaligenaceae bacterium]|nr:copper chaperone PCu(A)C [Alcaligenaceae bacterium]
MNKKSTIALALLAGCALASTGPAFAAESTDSGHHGMMSGHTGMKADGHMKMSGHGMMMAEHAQVDAGALPVSPTVTASQCWIRMLPAPAPSGGFLVVHNAGDQDAVLTGASSPDYGMVMVHQTTEENGMSKMAMVDKVVIPAGQDLDLKPGGYHVMLEQAAQSVAVGGQIQLDFALASGQRTSVECKVKPPTAMKY